MSTYPNQFARIGISDAARSLPSLRLFLHHLLLPRKQLLPPAPH